MSSMYTRFFGLTEKPFAITPDPRYLFLSERHAEALAHLAYGIKEAGGFIQLTGEVGTGKTTVVRSLLQQLPAECDIALILNPNVTPAEFLTAIFDELHIAVPDRARGSVEAAGLDADAVPILVGTCGKALGTFGAFVAGPAALIEYLVQRARTYIYTTALPPGVAAATRASLAIIDAEPWRRLRLLALVQRFRLAAQAAGLTLADSQTPIQPVIVGSAARALAVSAALFERGYWVPAIRPPTVPKGTSRLRVTLSAIHGEEDIDGLVAALAEILASLGPGPDAAA